MNNNIKVYPLLKNLLAPLLLAWYPIIFLYNQNVEIINLPSLYKPSLFSSVFVFVVYGIMVILLKKSSLAGIATCVFLVFFYLYGTTYDVLIKIDLFTIEHYTLLPLTLVLSSYIAFFVAHFSRNHAEIINKSTSFILTCLVLINLVGIIPKEVRRAIKEIPPQNIHTENITPSNTTYPDIYFFIFDEFSGFNAIRSYWGYSDIDDFNDFLTTHGFYVAERSSSETIDTLVELSNRLNFTEYSTGLGPEAYFEAISDNDVMRFLKSYGYSIVVFDETRASFAYPSKTPIRADFSFDFDPTTMDEKGVAIDDFGQMIFNMTMIRPLVDSLAQNNPIISQHRSMVYYTLEKVASLDEVPSPKFVYVHLILPHMPFIFDANGNLVDAKYHQDWNYYLGNYIYTTKLIQEAVIKIQDNSSPDRPPIVILQSDHGARNKKTGHPDSINFPDFQEELKFDIMVAINIPGYDYSTLPDEFKPENTFRIIINHLFGSEIPLKK